MENKKILVIDDEKEITDLVEIYLKEDGYRVIKGYTAQEALQLVQTEDIDLAILDVMLPDLDGFTLCRQLRRSYFFPIIMLTAKVEQGDKVNGIMMGADDYVTKPFFPVELLARVKAQLRRASNYNAALEQQRQQEVYEIGGLSVNADNHTCTLYGEEVELTATEFEIMLYLCRNKNQVVTSEELFEKVWKEKYYDSNNTVFVHIARIREKLRENARKPKFIKTVWGVGYKLVDGIRES